MIELKNLPEKERCVIGSQCDKFFLTINKLKSMNSVFTYLKKELGLPNNHDKEIWCVITCAAKTFKRGLSGSQFSLSPPVYKIANEAHGLKLNAVRASTVVRTLGDKGFLTYYKGYGTPIQGGSGWMRSCVIFSDTMRGLFTASMLKMVKSEHDITELIDIKDSKTKKSVVSFLKVKGIVARRNFMKEFNGVLNSHKISLFGNLCAVNYKQIFSDDFDSGGRIYSFGTFQTLPSELRKHIKIDGCDTVEIDISNLHGNILKVLQEVPRTDYDMYFVEGYPRYLCKAAMMCMVNCKTKSGSSKALYNIVKDSDWDFTQEDCSKVVNGLEKRNKPLKFFGKESSDWRTLQRLDSKICEYIIGVFVKHKKPVLCYHDSWRVKVEDENLLNETIQKAWKFVMQVTDECKTKRED